MPRTKLLVSALALALAGMSTAQAQEFSAVISFGDSLSDAGQYTVLIGAPAGSFTTNPDDVWTQVLASAWGLSQTASLAGGTNYAYGGAPTSFSIPPIPLPLTCIPATLPCRSVAQQIGTHLAGNGGHADPNALYTYWAGANDIFNWLTYASPRVNPADPTGPLLPPLISASQAQTFTGASALTAVGEIKALQTAGAQHIVVLNLPDIGMTPSFRGTVNQASVSGLVFAYNTTFNGGLAGLADGIIPINAYGLINEVIADPGFYGFSNVTGTACATGFLPGGSSLFCTPATYVAPGANETYLFADGVHPSGAAHRMLAGVVVATIQAPGQVSMAGEVPLRVYDQHSGVMNQQIFGMSRAPRDKGESNVYGQLQYSHADYDATVNTGAFDSNIASGTLGADVRYSDNISLGAAVTFGGTRGDSSGHDIDANEVLISAYGVAHWGSGYVNLILSGGSSSMDIDRGINFGPSTRIENGDTTATHTAAEIGGGFAFGSDDFRHGPYLSLVSQRVKVKGYSEDSLDSTSMWFGEFTRQSSVARLGYQLQGNAGSVHPYGRFAYAQESDDDSSAVQAGSNTMNGHFTFNGFIPASEWYEADVGVEWDMNESTELSFAWRGQFSADNQDFNTVSFGARWEF